MQISLHLCELIKQETFYSETNYLRNMYTNQLRKYMEMDPAISKQNGGVHAMDELPTSFHNVPRAYIINSQESSKTNNGHWLCIYCDGHKLEYFDSLGNPPEYYSNSLRNLLESNRIGYQTNIERLQAQSSAVCGHYCLYFCYYRCRGKPMTNIVREAFTRNWDLNDLYVYDFVCSHFDWIL